MNSLSGFAVAAVVATLSLTGCGSDPAFATGAGFPAARGPGLSWAPGPFSVAPAERTASVEHVHETRERESRNIERPVARRPRSGCPSCE
jgi:hypothetical protein